MNRKKSKKLTDIQKRLLLFIQKFKKEHGYAPSFREMRDQVGISSISMVHYYLDQLEELGRIERNPNVSRSIRVIEPVIEQPEETATAIQLQAQDLWSISVRGRIVASQPIPVPSSDFNYYDAEATVEVAPSMLPGHIKDLNQIFALEVQGDSMIEDLVNDGDIVIMQPAIEANNGDMVAVWLPDKEETTLKKIYHEKDRTRLQPSNPTMDPIYIPKSQSIEIQGKVLLVISQK